MKILLTGASGYLGRRVARRAAEFDALETLWSGHASRPERIVHGEPVHLDLTRPADVEAAIRRLGPDVVIHTAAINPGGPPERMMTVNRDGSAAVARAARDLGARLVHVSTDVVHDGTAAPYADDAPPTPLDQPYPLSKAAGERAVREILPSAAIVRTSLIYDLDELDAGTASFAARLAAGEPVRLFGDVLRQPVWAKTLAEALLRLAESSFSGLLNVAGSENLSRDAFGRRMLAFHGVADLDDPRLESISAAALGIAVPRDLRLELERAREVLGIELPGVGEVLRRTG